MSIRSLLTLTALLGSLCGCGGNPYGYARTYAPLDNERALYERTPTPVYENVVRDPVRYAEEPFSWFGVVEDVQPLPDGRTRLRLGHRLHQERHLCAERSDRSCRVTVSERSMGPFEVVLELRPEERAGKSRVWVGSLLRVYGTLDLEADPEQPPRMNVAYYRHWPRMTWVTTAARATMRR